ncbi:MAG TPA: hypothetical protein VMP89_11645, partial [Solirubrobacteraceae bacterium]|nr:hypothetical protein [Solirubrobacteraceae bacterium]
MSEPSQSSADPASGATEGSAPRRHRFLVGTLFTLATVIGVFAVLAVWANRQVLNTDNWTTTSSNLLADKAIQNAIA